MNAEPRAGAQRAPLARAAPPAATPTLEQKWRAATDVREFLRSIHGAAQTGDAQAQYYLYRGLQECEAASAMMIDTQGRLRTPDEALEFADRAGFDPGKSRELHERCRALLESGSAEFGRSEEWLRLAANGALPIAQTTLAGLTIYRGVAIPAGEDAELNARRLMGSALRSGDPEAIWAAGDLRLLSDARETFDGEKLAWYLAACLRGLDCGPGSAHWRDACGAHRGCQLHESIPDVIQRMSSGQYPLVEERARAILALIDAGEWEELGFGVSTDDP